MKTRIALTSTLAALLPLAAFAQTPTPPDVPPQPAVAPAPPVPAVPPAPPMPPHHGMRHDDQPRGPYTFLGVETSRVSRVVSEQLGLPRGFGVVVDYVVPESAAAAAGVQQSDIIKMLNDQIVIDSEQLGILVRSFADGTTVNLTVLRKGREMKLTAKLQQKQEKSRHGPVGYEWNFDGMDGMKDLEDMKDFEGMKDFHMPDMSAVREAVSRAKKEALRAGDEARAAARKLRIVTTDDGTLKSTHVDLGKAQIVFSDENGELRLETVDGKKMLTAKDSAGKVLFQGPIDTEEERAKVPAEVRKRYENLEHQDLPPIPPNEELAPHPPGPGESACLHETDLEQAALAPNRRTGWIRSTLLL